VRHVLLCILPELTAFFRALDVDGQTHLRRPTELNGGVPGIAEWLVLGELRALCTALQVLAAESPPPDLWTVKSSSSSSSSSSPPPKSPGSEAPAILSLLKWPMEQTHVGLAQLATLRSTVYQQTPSHSSVIRSLVH